MSKDMAYTNLVNAKDTAKTTPIDNAKKLYGDETHKNYPNIEDIYNQDNNIPLSININGADWIPEEINMAKLKYNILQHISRAGYDSKKIDYDDWRIALALANRAITPNDLKIASKTHRNAVNYFTGKNPNPEIDLSRSAL